MARNTQRQTSQDLRQRLVDLKGYEDEEKMRSLGDYYIAYKGTGVIFKDGLGLMNEALDFAYIYAKKGNAIVVLGKIEKLRILDASGKVIKQVGNEDPISRNIIGLSPDILEDPLSIGFVIKNKLGAMKKTNSYCLLRVDTNNKTIYEFQPKME